MLALYPLRFAEILRNYDFGGRWIAEAFDKEGLPSGHRLSETWEVCDRPGESSVTKNGSLSGTSLHELIALYGEALLGRGIMAEHGSRFPLLVKLLDATYPLAEQVHQDDALAKEQGQEDPGKTEAWYLLKTKPGAMIHCGTREGVSRARVLDALVDGTVRDSMERQPASAGDAFLLHAGAMHYSSGGILLYEILQNSNVITMLCSRETPGSAERRSWAGDAIKAVRLARGSDCRVRPVMVSSGSNRVSVIVACRYFALERLDLGAPHSIACTGDRFFVLTQVEGTSTVSCSGGQETLGPGQSCLLPASLGNVTILPQGGCSVLKGYVPDLLRNIVEPLRAAGIPDADIIGLGGEAALNPLVELTARPR
jgi:mannose-6-phosphate isomerase